MTSTIAVSISLFGCIAHLGSAQVEIPSDDCTWHIAYEWGTDLFCANDEVKTY